MGLAQLGKTNLNSDCCEQIVHKEPKWSECVHANAGQV